MRLKYLFFFVCFFLFLPFRFVYAADFKTDYDVHYYLDKQDQGLASRVSMKIKMKNLKPDLYIKKFTLMFPKTFQIGNIRAKDDFSDLLPEVTSDDGKHVIGIELSNPQYGVNTENNIYLDLMQYNLFKVNGGVWEVILPTIENREDGGDYTVTVHLPADESRKISLSKPKPTNISSDGIVWKNPSIKTIYAIFGTTQHYKLQLRYTLKNPQLTRVYTDIAFPPDTAYQKTFVESINPVPSTVFSDEDGNYLGRYYLNPKEEKTILYSGIVDVFTEPREELREVVKKQFASQKNYLLTEQPLWNIPVNLMPQHISTISDIYGFTSKTLTYNYGRLNSDITRLGAAQALTYPDQAVCTEFSDVFVGLAREKGLYAREMQGYGFSSDQDLRPLSTQSDVLHSWVEYYDTTLGIWIPVDPTWEQTSGIDYYHSFDLNHVVFAIHGKKADYPHPGGSYKVDDTAKDVNILPSADIPQERKSLRFSVVPFQLPKVGSKTYSLKVALTNTGNTYFFNYPINVQAAGLQLSPATITLDAVAPYEKKEFTFEYRPESNFTQSKTTLLFSNGTQVLFSYELTTTPLYYRLVKNIAIVLSVLLLVILGGAFLRKKWYDKHI